MRSSSFGLCALIALGACTSDARPAGPVGGESDTSSASPSSAPADAAGGANAGDPAAPSIQRSTRSSLQWKRYATFESDLSAALELPASELCREFGTEPCIRGVHLGPLGGHDIRTGLLDSPAEPLITTPSVVERVVLSACLARADKERREGVRVFAGLDLAGDAPAPGSEGAKALVSSLVRRFLARDPSADELDVLGGLARDPSGGAMPAATFAVEVCLALGSASEFLFF